MDEGWTVASVWANRIHCWELGVELRGGIFHSAEREAVEACLPRNNQAGRKGRGGGVLDSNYCLISGCPAILGVVSYIKFGSYLFGLRWIKLVAVTQR